MARPIQFSEGEFYHLYNRGTDKRDIFLSQKDKDRFLKLLYLCNSKNPVDIGNYDKSEGRTLRTLEDVFVVDRGDSIIDIGAYCLMPNHFHILVHEKEEGGISNFMRKLSTGYVMYFNLKYDRTGTLFEGKFRARHLDKDNYLKYIFAYIHLNPVKLVDPGWKEKGIRNLNRANIYLEKFKHSSYPDYLGAERRQGAILNTGAFPKYFSNSREFNDFIQMWLNYSDSNKF